MKTIAYLLLFACNAAIAFPTMLTYGYKSCTTCHVSQTGGGILTPYGKGAARDILSEYDSVPQIPLPEWLSIGGDLRVLQTRLATKGYTNKKFTLMQADLEVAVGDEKIKAVGSVGYQNPATQAYSGTDIFSRRHFLQYTPSPNVSIQLGRNSQGYGLNWPDHWLIQKAALGFGEGTEAYQIRIGVIGQEYEASAYLTKEKALGTRLLLNSSNYQIGFNTYTAGQRFTAGPELNVAISQLSIFANLDADFPATGPAIFYRTVRFNYELQRGIHLWAVHESTTDRILAHTFGVNLYPAVHLEISAAIQFSQIQVGWLMGHLYL